MGERRSEIRGMGQPFSIAFLENVVFRGELYSGHQNPDQSQLKGARPLVADSSQTERLFRFGLSMALVVPRLLVLAKMS